MWHKYEELERVFWLGALRSFIEPLGVWGGYSTPISTKFPSLSFRWYLGRLPVVFTVCDIRLQRGEWHTVQCMLRNARRIGCAHAVLKSKSLLRSNFVLGPCKHLISSSFSVQSVISVLHYTTLINLLWQMLSCKIQCVGEIWPAICFPKSNSG